MNVSRHSNPVACMLLCEVALGRMNEKVWSNENLFILLCQRSHLITTLITCLLVTCLQKVSSLSPSTESNESVWEQMRQESLPRCHTLSDAVT